MKDTNEIQKLLTEMIRGFIRYPADLECHANQVNGKIYISYRLHADDTPKLIGSRAETINAFREIAYRMAFVVKAQIQIEDVLESTTGEREYQDPYRFNPKYDCASEVKLLERVARFIFGDEAEAEKLDSGPESSVLIVYGAGVTRFNALERALCIVFMAIGKNRGRKLFVELSERKP